MGFGFRKSVKIGKGVRLNFSKRGVGISAGGKGFRVSSSSSGTRMRTSIPGTGLYYEKRLGNRSRSSHYNRYQSVNQLRVQEQRMQEREYAALQVELFESKVELLKSIHKDCSEPINWMEREKEVAPFPLGEKGPAEKEAAAALQKYSPSFTDKLFGRVDARKKILQDAILESYHSDQSALEDWENSKLLAKEILQGSPSAYQAVLQGEGPFDELEELGSNVRFHVVDKERIEITFIVGEKAVIPTESLSLTKTGKLSKRAMTKTNYYELYQDFVCSSVLRIAREVFALLPVKEVLIHGNTSELNTSTGYEDESTIISVHIHREQINELNMEYIDCSDALELLGAKMLFKKTKGFGYVRPVLFEE